MRMCAILAAAALAALVAGCEPPGPRGKLRIAALAGAYTSAVGERVDGALVEASDGLLARAVAQINREPDLDLVVILGDLMAGADPLSLDQAKAALEELDRPYVLVLGDHDGPRVESASGGNVSRTTVLWAFQGHGPQGPRGYWSRQIRPGVLLVGLDTPWPGAVAGHVDAEQLAWLERTLRAAADQAVLVVAHHGLVPLHPLDQAEPWRETLVDNAAEVLTVLERHPNVLLVLTGHHHFAVGRAVGPTVHAAAPSLAVWPAAYALVEVRPEEIEMVWVPAADEATAARAQDRLLSSERWRGVFPEGEAGDAACVRLFGANKLQTWSLEAIRP